MAAAVLGACCKDSSAGLAGGYGSLGETEPVRAEGVLGAAVGLVGREFAVGVNLCLESLQEGLAGGCGRCGQRCGSMRFRLLFDG